VVPVAPVTRTVCLDDFDIVNVPLGERNITVPIYEFSDGRYCVDILVGKKRKRITRASLEAAKIEARKLIAQIAAGRAAASGSQRSRPCQLGVETTVFSSRSVPPVWLQLEPMQPLRRAGGLGHTNSRETMAGHLWLAP